jgi:hypothetical protein
VLGYVKSGQKRWPRAKDHGAKSRLTDVNRGTSIENKPTQRNRNGRTSTEAGSRIGAMRLKSSGEIRTNRLPKSRRRPLPEGSFTYSKFRSIDLTR